MILSLRDGVLPKMCTLVPAGFLHRSEMTTP